MVKDQSPVQWRSFNDGHGFNVSGEQLRGPHPAGADLVDHFLVLLQLFARLRSSLQPSSNNVNFFSHLSCFFLSSLIDLWMLKTCPEPKLRNELFHFFQYDFVLFYHVELKLNRSMCNLHGLAKRPLKRGTGRLQVVAEVLTILRHHGRANLGFCWTKKCLWIWLN